MMEEKTQVDHFRESAQEGVRECNRVIAHLKGDFVLGEDDPPGSEAENALYFADGPHWHQARAAYLMMLLRMGLDGGVE